MFLGDLKVSRRNGARQGGGDEVKLQRGHTWRQVQSTGVSSKMGQEYAGRSMNSKLEGVTVAYS